MFYLLEVITFFKNAILFHMKYQFPILLCFLVLSPFLALGQILGARGVVQLSGKESLTGKRYALVVGISDYQNPAIPDLKFADRDARAFSEYLKDPNGGGLDAKNVQVLLNDKATAGNVIAAFYGMLDQVAEGDLFIFYFSGHGDLETKTMNQPGFLLCWDAPPSVYMSGGTFGLIYLQELISTLSVANKAKVLMITDACRSGKLAGNQIGGNQLTAANLAKQYANEMKILSCQPDELSLEGTAWGGGRGVFSYYLLKGLQGFADRNEDQMVTLFEIERYLEDEVNKAVAPQHQLPMAVGNKSANLIPVNKAHVDAWKDSVAMSDGKLLATNDKGSFIDIQKTGDMQLLKDYQQFLRAMDQHQLIRPRDSAAFDYLSKLSTYAAMKPYLGKLRHQLAASLIDEAQQAINDYLKSDPVELRKRWSYNERYELYPEFLDRAMELIGTEHSLYSMLQSRRHYFKGLNLRLRAERNKDKSLFKLAMQEQQKCIALEPAAAFALNEMGLLERRNDRFEQAIGYFEKAVALCPVWSLPWANLCASYNDLGQFDKAIHSGRKACEVDELFPLAQYNLGLALQNAQQTEEAVVCLNKAIALDTLYANAYFNLALAYYVLGNFAEAKKSILHYIHLKPKDPQGYVNLGEIERKLGNASDAHSAFHSALRLDPESYEAHISLAEYYRAEASFERADSVLLKNVQLHPKDALSYFYLASNACQQNKINKVLPLFEKAFQFGFKNDAMLQEDACYNVLRKDSRFIALLKKYRPKLLP